MHAATPGPILETERLLLRPPQLADLEDFVRLMGDAEHVRFIGGAQPRSMVWRALMTQIGAWQACGFAMFSVIEKASGRWIGRLGPWQTDGWPGTEVGWTLVRDAQGRGYAVEGATAAMDWAVDHLGWSEIVHTIDPDNVPSQRVAARLGSTLLRMGRLPAPHDQKDIGIWGQSRAAWLARRRPG
ncbi:GNAT family N-acetyltransferase [Coralloluteibacterium stylophorae]|uniref:GNAT family N-acetyltransferase n=1 Tax=Coralloluteibacterium stylophorae TaxID=1776034 RepID=A0A8J7VYS3_9GAMM|nr:GNAT family N-acetyltransferase [Coralloluteibacterium stylophorae]MBS7455831.1 GNAT family N-acetyltransferase [Coralloluteibacterium stylophorae]